MSSLEVVINMITVDAVTDEVEQELIPSRQIHLGKLVIAVGSVSNYFCISGAEENTISLPPWMPSISGYTC